MLPMRAFLRKAFGCKKPIKLCCKQLPGTSSYHGRGLLSKHCYVVYADMPRRIMLCWFRKVRQIIKMKLPAKRLVRR